MEYRELAGGKVSVLGLGCMRFPKASEESERIDYEKAQEIVDLAYQKGVNYFDTAYFYHGGDSERFIGPALKKYPRDSYYLTDKMPTPLLETEEDMERLFNEQLERTGADFFDYYLVHCLNESLFEKMQRLGLYEFLQEKKSRGLIQRIGFSFHDTPEVLETICAAYPWEFVQLQINYLDWTEYRSREQYEIARRYGLPIIVMEPVRGGGLANLGPEANSILEKAAPGDSIASWALRYAAGLEGVQLVLSGMSTPGQVEDNVKTFSSLRPLSPAEETALAAALEIYRKGALIPCTGCRYCVPCPVGVNIPAVFALYNECAFHGMDRFKKRYEDFPADEKAGQCVSCGQCVAMCPQALQIPQLLEKLERCEKPK